ncbi:MAG: class I SAM-dependent methyltransferase [Gemmatimonadaceae bacterium]|nr:class I SAM-dependent methyltransferase [Gemmatimonadaceae bacterium]MBA3657056.1 class I SAM-dependent methyltransferase [Gemmatimonadaceae bacterium]
MEDKTREPQYQVLVEYAKERGLESLGLMTSQAWFDDPKRLAFTLSRYKFVAKMLNGSRNVLEIGCADAFGTRIVLQHVDKITAIDFDPIFIDDVKNRASDRWPIEAFTHDMLSGPVPGTFDGAFAMDVLEHIPANSEDAFLRNMALSLTEHGVAIVGIPSLESQAYASPISKAGHVNCKSMGQLRETMLRHFHNVFMFSMNDEVVHTGHDRMANYLIALCADKR